MAEVKDKLENYFQKCFDANIHRKDYLPTGQVDDMLLIGFRP